MNKFIALAVMCTLPVTGAANDDYFDIEIGRVSYKAIGDGVWYQESFEHVLDMKSVSYSVNGRYPIKSWLDVRLGFFDLGKVSSNAYATQWDRDYDMSSHVCLSTCEKPAQFIGEGSVKGFSLSLQPTYRMGDWSFFGEIGLIKAKVTWSMKVKSDEATGKWEWWDCGHCSVDTWTTGQKFGLGVSFKSISFVFSLFEGLDAKGKDPVNGMPIFDRAQTLMLRVAL